MVRLPDVGSWFGEAVGWVEAAAGRARRALTSPSVVLKL